MSKVLAKLPVGEKVGIAFSGGLDTSVAVISRLRRKISPFQGGRDHLSHRLIRAGLARPMAAVALWVLSGIFAGCAVLIPMLGKSSELLVTAIGAALWVGLFIFFIRTADN